MPPAKGRVAGLKKEAAAAPLTPQRKALADKNAQLEAEVDKLTKLLDAAALDAKSTLEKLDEKENANKTLSAQVHKLQKVQAFKPQLPVELQAAEEAATKKEKKDPRQPHRPLSAFVLWSKDQRPQVQKENPEASFGALSTLLGEKWKNVSAEKKKPYEDQAKSLNDVYKEEKKVYEQILAEEKKEADAVAAYRLVQKGQAQEELWKQFETYQQELQQVVGAKKEKKEKDADKPKRPLTSFLAFANERRPLIVKKAGDQKLSVPEVGKQLGAEWNKLSEKQKAKYEKMVAEDAARYKTEMEAYKAKKEQDEQAAKEAQKERNTQEKAEALKLYSQQEREKTALQLLKQKEAADIAKAKLDRKEKRESKKRDPNKPKRPLSGYLLFSNEVRNEVKAANPEATFGQLATIIAAKWKALAPEQQGLYNQKVLPQWQQYEKDMEAYHLTLYGYGEMLVVPKME
ncbi:high mobility group box protein [Klebsormidium nitens]|uniref:High mobility group box protein n=1 Tax=Klebsormidium nitens TaxID=105231 RepID=A0A1Y1HVV7_KLENI|nr:high mobility group box protein [Klebsormidium nitens]|eukprot:GAQ80667.1 high mobility group box protein [Klebsormidium nitens]